MQIVIERTPEYEFVIAFWNRNQKKIEILGDYKNAIRDKETIIYGNMVR